jgi:protein SCO1/2
MYKEDPMSDKKYSKVMPFLIVCAMAAFITGFFISQHLQMQRKKDLNQFHGTLLNKPRALQPVTLTGIDHQPFTNTSLQGQWTFLFFGFTHCGYMCPTTMAELGKMYRLLEKQAIQPLPHVMMISIDPKRDNLEKLGYYVRAFHPNFYGANGSDDAVKAIAKEMGIAYAKIAHKNLEEQDYDIEHTGTIILINPQGKLCAFFTTPHSAEQMAEDYQLLVS